MTRSIGVILLVIFLIVYGLLAITNIRFELQNFLVGTLAIGAGIFLAIGK